MKRIKDELLLSQKDLTLLLGISADRLQYWIRSSLIKPSILQKGRGKSHLFNLKNLFYIALAYQFDKLGLDLEAIQEIIKGKNKELEIYATEFAAQNRSFPKPFMAIFRKAGKPNISFHESGEEIFEEFDKTKALGIYDLTASSMIIVFLPSLFSQLNIKLSGMFWEQTSRDYLRFQKRMGNRAILPFKNFLLGMMIEARSSGNTEKIDQIKKTLMSGRLPEPYSRESISPEKALKLFEELS
ncbi:MAG: MerR family transcriptional regulator [Candidatus Aminicenantales bacterium]